MQYMPTVKLLNGRRVYDDIFDCLFMHREWVCTTPPALHTGCSAKKPDIIYPEPLQESRPGAFHSLGTDCVHGCDQCRSVRSVLQCPPRLDHTGKSAQGMCACTLVHDQLILWVGNIESWSVSRHIISSATASMYTSFFCCWQMQAMRKLKDANALLGFLPVLPPGTPLEVKVQVYHEAMRHILRPLFNMGDRYASRSVFTSQKTPTALRTL
jgi:hypothetical protein